MEISVGNFFCSPGISIKTTVLYLIDQSTEDYEIVYTGLQLWPTFMRLFAWNEMFSMPCMEGFHL